MKLTRINYKFIACYILKLSRWVNRYLAHFFGDAFVSKTTAILIIPLCRMCAEYLLFFVFSSYFRIPGHLAKQGIENI